MTRIYFNEVVTRDGFQIEPHFMATDDKVALIDALSQCGYAKIEATSFTSPKAIPMLRDAEEVMGRIRRVPGVETTVLVPNVRGAERALESRAAKGNEKALDKSRAHIRDRLTQLAPIFLKNKFMLGDSFSMLDVAIAPLLWRLDYYGIDLSKNAAPLLKYAERIFSRPAYIEALTPSEKVMRK